MNRDMSKLVFLYEAVSQNLPPGITPENIMSLEEYVQDICNSAEEVKESADAQDPTVGTNVKTLTPEEISGMITHRAAGEMFNRSVPYLHKSNIVDENGNPIDQDKLKAMIKHRPDHILNQNEKMGKSSGGSQVFYDISLPAYSGMFIDEKKPDQPFKILRTCPNAGKCLGFCYAKKGGYIQWKDASLRSTQILNYLMNDWTGFKQQLLREIQTKTINHAKRGKQTVVRWHDAGDFFSEGYLQIAFDIARQTPDTLHYAYTKDYDKYKSKDKPQNFVMNISFGGTQDEKIDVKKDKVSQLVPKNLFKDLTVMRVKQGEDDSLKWKFTPQNLETLKTRIAKQFGANKKTLITYDELMKIPYNPATPHKWSVLVWPGHGDQAATREDVGTTFLLEH